MKCLAGTVLFLTLFFSLAPRAFASGSSLYLSPSFMTPAIGETFEVRILADTGGARINAAEAQLSFDTASLSIDHVSIAGSILSSWPTPPAFSNADGTVHFSGWAKVPYTGGSGLLLTVTFKALRNQTSALRFTSGSLLSADDESNSISDMRSAIYAIEPHAESAVIPPAPPDLTPTAVTSVPRANADSESVGAAVARPIFGAYASEVAAGQPIIVHGNSAAGTSVYVWSQRDSDPVAVAMLPGSADGSFTFVSDTPAKTGQYRVWALAQDATGRQSPLSETITIVVRPTSAAAVVLAFASTMAPYALLVTLTAGIVAYLFYRHRKEGLQYETLTDQ